jgi:hypothetical protein
MSIMETIAATFGAFRDAFRGHTESCKRHGKLATKLERQVQQGAHPEDAIEAAPPLFHAAGEAWRQRYGVEIIRTMGSRLVKEGDDPVALVPGTLPDALALAIPGWAWALLERPLLEGYAAMARSIPYEPVDRIRVQLAAAQATESEMLALEAEILARHEAAAQLDPPLDLPLPPALAARRKAEEIRLERQHAAHVDHELANRRGLERARAASAVRELNTRRARAIELAGPGGSVVDIVNGDGSVAGFEITTSGGETRRVGFEEV